MRATVSRKAIGHFGACSCRPQLNIGQPEREMLGCIVSTPIAKGGLEVSWDEPSLESYKRFASESQLMYY